jgi:phage-related protein
MEVLLHSGAEDELVVLRRLSVQEHAAMLTALARLKSIGLDLRFPHTSQVKGTKLRELRPRAGRSPWRAFYRRVGDVLVVGAIGPEAEHDRRGFQRAIDLAAQRIGES